MYALRGIASFDGSAFEAGVNRMGVVASAGAQKITIRDNSRKRCGTLVLCRHDVGSWIDKTDRPKASSQQNKITAQTIVVNQSRPFGSNRIS
jgi:hypothetical protein